MAAGKCKIVGNAHWFFKKDGQIWTLDNDTEANDGDPLWDFDYKEDHLAYDVVWMHNCIEWWHNHYSDCAPAVYLGVPDDHGVHVWDFNEAGWTSSIGLLTFRKAKRWVREE